MECIAAWQNAAKRGHNINHEVDADQIIETEHACLGDTHGTTHQRVSLFDAEIATHRLINPDLKRKDSNTVAKKAWCIGTSDDALAKDAVIEICKAIDHVIAGLIAAHKLQQSHIAHRVEIMGNGKPFAETVWHVFDQQADRNGRSVGADNTVGTDGFIKATIQGLFYV